MRITKRQLRKIIREQARGRTPLKNIKQRDIFLVVRDGARLETFGAWVENKQWRLEKGDVIEFRKYAGRAYTGQTPVFSGFGFSFEGEFWPTAGSDKGAGVIGHPDATYLEKISGSDAFAHLAAGLSPSHCRENPKACEPSAELVEGLRRIIREAVQGPPPYVLERSGVGWNERFMSDINRGGRSADLVASGWSPDEVEWGPLERAQRFDNQETAEEFQRMVDDLTGLYTNIQSPSIFEE